MIHLKSNIWLLSFLEFWFWFIFHENDPAWISWNIQSIHCLDFRSTCWWSFYAVWIWWRYVCDKVCLQWSLYQLQEILEHFYMKPETEPSQSTHWQPSYWSYASELWCELAPAQKNPSKFLRIDKYWSKVGKILNESGNLKYPQLFQLGKAILSLLHWNSAPQHAFSINKILLDAHRTSMGEDTTSALHFCLFGC